MESTAQDFADEQLNASLTSAQTKRAAQFLESFPSTTHALRAVVAVMCGDHENMEGAALLEGILEKLALIEGEQA